MSSSEKSLVLQKSARQVRDVQNNSRKAMMRLVWSAADLSKLHILALEGRHIGKHGGKGRGVGYIPKWQERLPMIWPSPLCSLDGV